MSFERGLVKSVPHRGLDGLRQLGTEDLVLGFQVSDLAQQDRLPSFGPGKRGADLSGRRTWKMGGKEIAKRTDFR